jgi:microcystin-dependent protein
MFAGNFAPQDWVACDGRLLNISENDALYALLGTTYGGDGVNTFGVPDLRGRAPFHRNGGYPLGAAGGTETVTLTQESLAAHTHLASVKTGNGQSSAPAANFWAGCSDYDCYAKAVAPTASFAPSAIGPAGGSEPHDNMMPFLAMSFIMATVGIYPTPN